MEELVKKLYDNPDEFNYDAVKEIRKNKGKINSYLLAELDKNITNYNNEEGFSIFVDYALFLLAEFKEKKTFPLILKLLSIPNLEHKDIGDGIMEKLFSIIVSVFDGDFEGLNAIIENKNIDYTIRSRVIETYTYFYNKAKIINKKDLIAYLRKIIDLYEYDDDIYDAILTIIINTRLIEMIPDVQKMFENEAIDYFVRGGYPEFIDYLFDYEDDLDDFDVIDNVEDNMAWWYCFKKDKNERGLDEEKFKNVLKTDLKKFILHDLENHVVDYSDVGRNAPCPCGSGKKYKKCCLNNVSKNLPYQKYINESLRNYPKKNNNKDELDFYTVYDAERIAIDTLMYKALKEKHIPMYIKRDILKEHKNDFANLDKAYQLIKELVQKRNIKTIDEYDEKVSIHFSLYSFFKYYTDLIIEKINNENKDYLENLKEIISYFYTTFIVDEEWEYLYLDRINHYYLFTKKYKEAIEFFESKLNNKKIKYDVCNYLFNLYSLVYKYGEWLNKMNDIIDNEKDKKLKCELTNLKRRCLEDEEYEYE